MKSLLSRLFAKDKAPPRRDMARLFPVLVPAELLEMAWPGPVLPLDGLPLAVSWAFVGADHVWDYVVKADAEAWDEQGLDWEGLAFENLFRISEAEPASHEAVDEVDRPYMYILLNHDGLGPSRLLLPHLFDDPLGPDYLVAVPERTCAVAWRADVTPEQKTEIEDYIAHCFANGKEPVSAAPFAASRFWQYAGDAKPGEPLL